MVGNRRRTTLFVSSFVTYLFYLFFTLRFSTMMRTPLHLLLLQLMGIVAVHGNTQLRRPLASEGASESISQNFVLDGVEINFLADEVDGDFCDASSPLSLAGYMNGEFILYSSSFRVIYFSNILTSYLVLPLTNMRASQGKQV